MTDMRSRLRPGTRRVAALGAVSYAAIFLAGCGAASSSAGSGSSAPSGTLTSTHQATPYGASAGAEASRSTSGGVAQPPSSAATAAPDAQAGIPAGAKVERTATLSLEVKREQFDGTLDRVFSVMKDLKGYVAGSDLSGDTSGLRSGTVSFRVPSDRFEEAIARVRGLGTVKSLAVSGTDVSSQYVDLTARLRNQEAQEQATLALYSQAKGVQDVISVQNQLATIREQIERYKGQLTFLDSQVNYSTVSVAVTQAGIGVAPGGDEWGFRTAVVQAAHYAVSAIDIVVVVLGAASPVLVLGALGGLVAWRVRQRMRSGPRLA